MFLAFQIILPIINFPLRTLPAPRLPKPPMIRRLLATALAALALLGCQPPEPIRIGFLGGLSDRASDVGEAGRNGVQLALEERNAAGGIRGRPLELLVRDDAQTREIAAKGAAELIEAKVEAIVGPFASAMAAAALPHINRNRVVMVSPTITSMDFYGNDDYLFRINRTTRDNAHDYARRLFAQGQRRVAVAYDLRNRSFTESWFREFESAFSGLGGKTVVAVTFESRPDADFGEVVRAMLAAEPDGLMFLAAAIDLTRLCQHATLQAPQLPIAAAEWAASEKLIELGGKALEGLVIVQAFDRDDRSARYQAFRSAYFKRFQREPGYSSVLAYDAATALFDAMEQRTADETLKQALVRHAPFQGLQQQIAFDANGDTPRTVYFTRIRDGRYVLLD
jgi:branched-chain amino acid transport system substrate-binding protein